MNKYNKGANEEEQWNKDKLPIPNLAEDFIWMQVSPGSKIRNLLETAWNLFDKSTHIVWSGSGPAIAKVITCVEITKRKYKDAQLRQYTKICYRKTKEYWDPKECGLDQLVVVRDSPAIHIALYKI